MSMVNVRKIKGIELRYDREPVAKYGSAGKNLTFQCKEGLVKKLESWVDTLTKYNMKPKYILTAGLYVNKAGCHGKGLAIDVDGLWFSENKILMTRSAPSYWKKYLAVESTLRMHFPVVLNYNYNAAHHDHWHCDLCTEALFQGGRSQILFLQQALNVFYGYKLTVDGIYGEKTNEAFRNIINSALNSGSWNSFLEKIASTWNGYTSVEGDTTEKELTLKNLAYACYEAAENISDEQQQHAMKSALNSFFTDEKVQTFLR